MGRLLVEYTVGQELIPKVDPHNLHVRRDPAFRIHRQERRSLGACVVPGHTDGMDPLGLGSQWAWRTEPLAMEIMPTEVLLNRNRGHGDMVTVKKDDPVHSGPARP